MSKSVKTPLFLSECFDDNLDKSAYWYLKISDDTIIKVIEKIADMENASAEDVICTVNRLMLLAQNRSPLLLDAVLMILDKRVPFYAVLQRYIGDHMFVRNYFGKYKHSFINFEYLASYSLDLLIKENEHVLAKELLHHMMVYDIAYIPISGIPLCDVVDLKLTDDDRYSIDQLFRKKFGIPQPETGSMDYKWMEQMDPKILFETLLSYSKPELQKVKRDCPSLIWLVELVFFKNVVFRYDAFCEKGMDIFKSERYDLAQLIASYLKRSHSSIDCELAVTKIFGTLLTRHPSHFDEFNFQPFLYLIIDHCNFSALDTLFRRWTKCKNLVSKFSDLYKKKLCALYVVWLCSGVRLCSMNDFIASFSWDEVRYEDESLVLRCGFEKLFKSLFIGLDVSHRLPFNVFPCTLFSEKGEIISHSLLRIWNFYLQHRQESTDLCPEISYYPSLSKSCRSFSSFMVFCMNSMQLIDIDILYVLIYSNIALTQIRRRTTISTFLGKLRDAIICEKESRYLLSLEELDAYCLRHFHLDCIGTIIALEDNDYLCDAYNRQKFEDIFKKCFPADMEGTELP